MLFLDDIPYVYDVVLSDFGRASTVRLLTELVDKERTRIQKLLDMECGPRVAPFFDEYRRIMFSCVGDVAYIKQDILSERQRMKPSLLDSSVLYGVKGTEISDEAIGRIADIASFEVEQAFKRGYRRFRLVIPCNTLAIIDNDLASAIRKRLSMIEVNLSSINGNGQNWRFKKNGELTIYTVPKAVLKYVNSSNTNAKLTLVGTSLAQEEYKRALKELGMESISIVEFSHEEQEVMDELLVASIGGDGGYVDMMKKELRQKVLSRYQTSIVVEASTDFNFGIGINSLQMFADVLLDDVYGPLEINERN
jgi:hypothetical protein